MAEQFTRVAETIAKLTPDGYEQGVNRVVAAAQRAVSANQNVEVSFTKVERSTVVTSTAIDRLQAANDKAFAAEQRRERQLDQLNRAMQQGTVTQDRYRQILASIDSAYDKATGGANKAATGAAAVATSTTTAARAVGLLRQGLQEATPHLEEYAQHGGTLSMVLTRLGPIGLTAAAVIGAISLAMLKGVDSYKETESSTVRLQAVLQATGNTIGVTVGQVNALAARMSAFATGNEVRDATAVVASFGQAGSLGFERIIQAAADMTAVFGGDLRSNTERLAEGLQKLINGEQNLGNAFDFMSASARAAVTELARFGQGGAAAQRALEEMQRTLGGASAAEAGTISGALRRSVNETSLLFETIARVTGATDRARASAQSWADAIRGVREALERPGTPSGQAAAATAAAQTTDAQIRDLEAIVARGEARMRGMSPEDRVATIARNPGYQDALRRLQAARTQREQQYQDLAAGRIVREGYNGEEQQATAQQAARNQADRDNIALTERRARATRELLTEQQRQLELDRLAPNIRAQQQAADQAEIRTLQAMTGSQEGNLSILRRLPAAQQAVTQAAVDQARAFAVQSAQVQQSGQAGQQLTQQQTEARRALEEQIRGLHDEGVALGQSERERYITQQSLAAERTGRQLNNVELQQYVARVRQEAAALYDTTAARRQQQQQLEETARAINRSVDRVVDFAADGINRILENGVGSWRSLWDEFVSLGRKAIAQTIAEALIRPIVVPIVTQLVGSFGGMFGIGQSSGGVTVQSVNGVPTLSYGGQPISASSSGGFSVPNMPSSGLLDNLFSGNLFSGNTGTVTPMLDAWAMRNLGFGQIDNFAGQAPGAMGPFQGGAGLFGGNGASGAFAGFSSFGNILGIAGAALPGLMSGNYAQAGFGAGGAALGTLILPGIGTMIGGFLGNLVGGLFGKKSIPFNTSSQLFSINGGLLENNGGTGRGEFTQGAGSLGNAYFQALQRLQTAAGGTIAGGPDMRFSMAGTEGSNPFYRALPNDQWYWGKGWADADSPEAALRIGLQQSIGRLQWSGVGRAAQYVLNTQGGGDFDQLLQNLQNAVQFQKAYDAAIGDTGETLSQVQQQVKALNEQFDAMKAQGATYGFAPTELEEARQRAIARMRDEFDNNVQQAILGITDPKQAALDALEKERKGAIKDAETLGADINEVERLYGLRRTTIVEQFNQQMLQSAKTLKAWLDAQPFGANSSSSPQTRLELAQQQFSDQVTAARGGDSGAFSTITGYADRLLQAARDMYASTVAFGAIEAMTRSTLTQLGSDLALPGFAAGGSFTVGGAGGTDSQVVAFRATPGETVEVSTPAQGAGGGDLANAVASLRREVKALNGALRASNALRRVGR